MNSSPIVNSPHSFTTFGDLLKFLRRRARLTQLELSIAVGYSESQISRLEQNQRLPDLTAAKALFIPALHLETESEMAARFLELAQSARQEDAPAPGITPYKGLLYFDETDPNLFFGREALTARLVEHVISIASDQSRRFLAVVGASGSGKSSLVRAGLVVTLKRVGWGARVFTPTGNPLSMLEKHLALKDTGGEERILILVDQLEELFTLCHNEIERIAFIDKLLSTAQDNSKKNTVVVALRADFYPHCAQYPLLRRAVAAEQEYIGQMSTVELRRAIEEPARRGGWEFEPGLVDLLLNDVGADGTGQPEPGALPLLSHALLATWERRRGHMLTLDGYHASGGVSSAIAETAESVFTDQLNKTQQDIARDVFLRLTELGEGTEDTRRRATLNELVRQSTEATQLRAVLNTLAEARLITLNEDNAEVSHEALIREWQRLHEWLTQDREGLLLHRHLTESAHEWEARGHDPAELYRGARLAQANEWSTLNPKILNAQERLFLDASNLQAKREEQEREGRLQRELDSARELAETRRQSASRLRIRNRVVTTVGSIAIILAMLAGMFGIQSNQNAISAQKNAETAFSRELASVAIENLTVDPQRSILLALHALSESHTQEAETALHRAVIASRLLQTSSIPDFEFFEVAFSPDGTRVVTSGCKAIDCDNTFNSQVRDAESLEVLFTLPGMYASKTWPDANGLMTINYADNPNSTLVTLWDNEGKMISATTLPIAFASVHGWETSPDQTREAILTGEGLITIWDLTNGQNLQTFQQAKESEFTFLAFSPDGKHLLIQPNRFFQSGWEGETTVLDIASGEEIVSYPIHGHSTFAPDGKRVAMLSERLKIWDLDSGQKLFDLHQESQFPLNDIRFSPDGTLLATVMKNGKAEIWDATTGDSKLILPGIARDPCALAISPDNSRLVVVTCAGQLQIWGISPEYSREWLTLANEGGFVSVSPDGKRLVTRDPPGNIVSVRDADSGQLQLTLTGHTAPIWDAAFSPDGTRLVTASTDTTAKVWDMNTGMELLTLKGHTEGLWSTAYSPNGKQIATIGYDKTARLWDAVSGRLLFTLDAYSETVGITVTIGVAFSPDGRYLATAGSGPLKIWDTVSGELLLTLPLSGEKAACVAYSPDGKYLAIGMAGGPASVWNIETGKKLFELPDHTATVVDIAFSPDGTHIATTSTDRTVKVWDAATGQLQLTLPEQNPFANALAFSPDGTRLITASDGSGSTRVWELNPNNLVQLAHSRLTRTITIEECQRYLHVDVCPVEP